jgi:hypothetical protein
MPPSFLPISVILISIETFIVNHSVNKLDEIRFDKKFNFFTCIPSILLNLGFIYLLIQVVAISTYGSF